VRRGWTSLATIVPLLWAGEVVGQACIGYPQGSAGALGASFSFPEDATGYAMGGMIASQGGGLFLQGSFGIVAYDVEQVENGKLLGGSVAYEVPSLAPDVSVCPTAGATFGWVEDLNTWSVPFGIGVGTSLALGRSGDAELTPYAIPQFIYVRESLDDVDDSAESDVFVGLVAGLTLSVDAFVVSGAVSKIFEEDVDAMFSVGVGVAWR
jgi:hypothetical protein